MINWLVANELLLPLGGGRASFVHQSLTEYLAARALVEQLQQQSGSAIDKILQRRWDNAIFLALGMLQADAALSFLQQIVNADAEFAIRGARYVEHDRERLLTMLLEALLASDSSFKKFHPDGLFKPLQFSDTHEVLLRKIVSQGGRLFPEAICALGSLLGNAYKPELMEMLFGRNFDWNDRYSIKALAPLVTAEDVGALVTRMLQTELGDLDEEESKIDTLIDLVSYALSEAPQDVIVSQVYQRIDNVGDEEARVLAALIYRLNFHAQEAPPLHIFVSLFKRGLIDSAYPLYSITRFELAQRHQFLTMLDASLMEALLNAIAAGDEWALSLLCLLCEIDPNVAERALTIVGSEAHELSTLITFAKNKDDTVLFTWLEAILEKAGAFVSSEPMQAIRFQELDWNGRHDLFVALLARRDLTLARMLLGGMIPVEINGLAEIDLGDPRPWIDWIVELQQREHKSDDEGRFVAEQVAYLSARSSSDANKKALLNMLESMDDSILAAVGLLALRFVDGVSIANLSEEATNNLLLLLKSPNVRFGFWEHPFAQIADESFIRDVLLPLGVSDDKKLRARIGAVIESAGRRLGVRFMLPQVVENAEQT